MPSPYDFEYADVIQLPLTYKGAVSDEWLDGMGHMNVAWYTQAFSAAMVSVLKQVGMDWEFFKQRDAGTFALEKHVRYVSELRLGQRLQVHSRLLGRSAKRMHAMHFMVNVETHRLAATCETLNAYIDMRVRKMAAIPDEAAQVLDSLIAEHQSLAWSAPVCGVIFP